MALPLQYRHTFITLEDEADEMAQRRSSSVPFRSLCSEPESPAPHSESYVARLGPRVAENFLWPIEMPDTTVGSLGHPEVCGRFCIRFVYGNCVKGPSCEFCHLEHKENKVKMDKAQRLLFETLNEAAVLALLLPQFEKRCEKQGMRDQMVLVLATLRRRLRTLDAPTADLMAKAKSTFGVLLRKMTLARLVEMVQQSHQVDSGFKDELKRLVDHAVGRR